jgi:hypothetical protein
LNTHTNKASLFAYSEKEKLARDANDEYEYKTRISIKQQKGVKCFAQ